MLDRQSSTFSVPLDQYAMNKQNIQIIHAAHAVMEYRCITGQQQLNAAAIANVVEYLHEDWQPKIWLYGFWDAPWLSAYGSPEPPGSHVMFGLLVDERFACVNDHREVYTLEPIAPAYGLRDLRFDESTNLSLLGDLWSDSYERTIMDSRFLQLNKQRNDCTASKGYTIVYPDNDGRRGFVDWLQEPTPEAQLRAAVTEAQCADDMNYTQQVVDVMAGYQDRSIKDHEAELIATKAILDGKVADATAILHSVGVM